MSNKALSTASLLLSGRSPVGGNSVSFCLRAISGFGEPCEPPLKASVRHFDKVIVGVEWSLHDLSFRRRSSVGRAALL